MSDLSHATTEGEQAAALRRLDEYMREVQRRLNYVRLCESAALDAGRRGAPKDVVAALLSDAAAARMEVATPAEDALRAYDSWRALQPRVYCECGGYARPGSRLCAECGDAMAGHLCAEVAP